MVTVFEILFILVGILLTLLILVQPARGEGGIAGAFGAGGTETFFGTRAHQQMSRMTIGLAVAALVLAIAINLLSVRSKGGGETDAPSGKTHSPVEKSK